MAENQISLFTLPTQNNRGGFDGPNLFEDEVQQQKVASSEADGISLNQIINGALGALGSGGVNFLRKRTPAGAIFPIIGGLSGLSNEQDALKNPTNAGNIAATLMSATGKGSPMAQSVFPQLIEGSADFAQNPTAETLTKQLGLTGLAAASPRIAKSAARKINERGVLEAENSLNELNTRGQTVLGATDIGSENIKLGLQPKTETITRGFDKTIDKSNRMTEAKARALESKALELEQLVTEKKLSGGAAQYKQRQANQLRNEAAKLRQEIKDPSLGTSKFTITTEPGVPKPGTVDEALYKVRDKKDPAFIVADEQQTKYFQAIDRKDYATANQTAESMIEFRTKYPQSLAPQRSFTKNLMTEAAAQIPNAPLGRGRQLNPESMRSYVERASKLSPEAKTAIFGSVKEGDEYLRFLATVPDALERGVERYKLHLGGRVAGAGMSFGLDSFAQIFNPDALVNLWFNRSYDKTGQASNAINLIRALASDDKDIVKILSQPGNFVRTIDNLTQLMRENQKAPDEKKKTPSPKAPAKPATDVKL